MYHKVSRDPLYSEIFLYPLEILATDSPVVQRLRMLSQLAGAQMSYPCATHTRFSHSLGVMHVSGLYAAHLFGEESPQFRLCRLAGLLHDTGHGPFSHQFDDVVYSQLGYDEGHDQFREHLLLEKLPKYMKDKFDNSPKIFKKHVMQDVEMTLGKIPNKPFEEIVAKVNEIFAGERFGDPLFNIVQGPLGADRMDFVLRDAYFSGVKHYGTVPIDRIIRNSSIVKVSSEKSVLSYNIKVVDDIYTVLFGRFMMYKNVYFHKTSRAADMMIQELLRKSMSFLNFKESLRNLDDFLQLTDSYVVERTEMLFDQTDKPSKELKEAREIIQRLKKRDLWKLVVEIPFSTTGIDPSTVSKSLGEEKLEEIRKRMKSCLQLGQINQEDKKEVERVLKNFDDIFIVDTPYKLTLVHPDEFLSNSVYIDDGNGKVMTFEEFEKAYPTYKLMSGNMLQLVRIYAKEDIRALMRKYDFIPLTSSTQLTTRW